MVILHSRWFLAALTVFACAISSLAQTKHAITHEDVWLMKRVSAPVPSPDGKWVVFSVVEPSYDEKEVVSDLWIVPGDGSAAPRKITNTKGAESGVTWAPDSKRIAFSAKRDGDDANQIYVLNVAAAGEAVRVTSLSTGARTPQFSPDGKMLLFASTVYPGALNDEDNKKITAERKARKYNARVYESFPIRYWDRWLTDQQTHLFVQSLDAGAQATDVLAGSALVKEKGFAGRMGDTSEEMDAVWTPEGDAIVFAATTEKNRAAYANVNTALYRVKIAGGEPVPLLNKAGNYSKPKFSPDGKALYCLFEVNSSKVYNLPRLAKLNWPVTEMRMFSGGLDRAVASFAIAPNNQDVYFTAEDAGNEKIYTGFGFRELPPQPLTKTGCYTNISLSADGAIFANWDDATHPIEIVRFDPVTKQHRNLTNFNKDRLLMLDWQPLREFTFTSRRSKPIHNFLALPPNFDANKKYPLFVVIHGGPHSQWRDQFVLRWNYHLLAAPGYVVLLTNYTGSTGFGEKFAQAIQGDPLLGPGEELNEAADEAIKRFKFIDSTRQAAGGASYGGHLANWLQATTTRYKCLISHAGLVNLETQWGTSDTIYSREVNNGGPVWEQGEIWRKQNPIRYAANYKTPLLITVGEQDFRVPLNNSLENWAVQQRLQIPSKLIVFPDANHWILKGEDSRFFYSEVHAWLKKWL
ncbi:MAG: prolyl oligopeptidase family serine peptidase [Blastocatellia bacterium]